MASCVGASPRAFAFGKNWLAYVREFLAEENVRVAEASLLRYLPREAYDGTVFIDVGCGSGVFSLGALRLGCGRVISLDLDPRSIEATRMVRARFAPDPSFAERWEVFCGSILDVGFVERLRGSGDIVYSWGVLHHAGNMYLAIEHCAALVRPGGHLILAIYNRAPSSEFWKRVKEIYNASPAPVQEGMSAVLFAGLLGQRLVRSAVRRFSGSCGAPVLARRRGMSLYHDVVDWLGGYPYEYAAFEEIQRFVEGFGLRLLDAPTRLPSRRRTLVNRFSLRDTGNNEFVFYREPEYG